jgi:hypothetical protein
MILDDRLKFSEDQAITADADSTNYMDLGAPGSTYDGVSLQRKLDQLGMSKLHVQITEAFDNLTTLDIIVEEASDSSFSADLKDVLTVQVPLAQLVAGFVVPGFESFPRGISQRYIQFKYNVNGTNPAAGKITAIGVAANDASYQG